MTCEPSATTRPATSPPGVRGNATGTGKLPASNQRSRWFNPQD